MYRLSLIVEDIYNKYLPLAEKMGIRFDLDFPDTTKRIPRPSRVKAPLDNHVSSAFKRTKGSVKVVVKKDGIEISDDGTVLSPAALSLINKPGHITAKSRVGFGTTIFIMF